MLPALCGSSAWSQTAYLVADLAPGVKDDASLIPSGYLSLGGKTLFFANPVGDDGDDLWVTDGTAAGTQRLPTPCLVSPCSSSLEVLTAVGGVGFFRESYGEGTNRPVGLWRSDGTRAGGFALPLGSFSVAEYGAAYAVAGGILYFTAYSDTAAKLWRSDGTSSGTSIVADLNTDFNFAPGAPVFLASAGGSLFLLGQGAPAHLWKSDGTLAGSVEVPGFQAVGGVGLLAVGTRIVAVGTDSSDSLQLWASDGTAAGTRQLTHLVTPSVYTDYNVPVFLMTTDAKVYFAVADANLGTQLWVSDLTPAGTLPTTAFGSSPGSSFQVPTSSQIVEVGGRLVFVGGLTTATATLWAVSPGVPASLTGLCAEGCGSPPELVKAGDRAVFLNRAPNDVVPDFELWSTDGTPAGTLELKPSICSPATGCSSYHKDVIGLGGAAYFIANDDPFTGSGELWRTDGTPAGTVRFTDQLTTAEGEFGGGPNLGLLQNRVLFAGGHYVSGGATFELWISDGTASATHQLTFRSDPVSSSPSSLVALGDQVFFVVHLGDLPSGTQAYLAQATGSSASVLQGPGGFLGNDQQIAPPTLLAAAGAVFYVAGDGNLWRSDGTAPGTLALTQQAVTANVPAVAAGGRVYFAAAGDAPAGAVWSSDGTPAGTGKLFDLPATLNFLHDLQVLGGSFYLVGENESGVGLWRSDGTAGGTVRLTDVQPGFLAAGEHLGLVELGGVVYFAAVGSSGKSLWRTDGTPAGTFEVTQGGNPFLDPKDLVVAGGALYFFAGASTLWRTDGGGAGPQALHDFLGDPGGLTPFGGGVAFFGDDGILGNQPWLSDGTPSGTHPIEDVNSGPEGLEPSDLTVADGRLFFAANDSVHGRELWESDGTAAGTRMVQDINPGPDSSSPSGMTAAGGLLYFAADDGLAGRELWALPLSSAAAGCRVSATALCLAGSRFKVEAVWRDFQGNSGAGNAVPLTGDTGTFWFFSPDNVEVIVKVLDGRPVDGHFWVFYGALSNVEYSLTVTDTQTGLTRRYFNPLGQLASVGDTHAFGPLGASSIGAPPAGPASAPAPVRPAAAPAGAGAMLSRVTPAAASRAIGTAASADAGGACQPLPRQLCLGGGRFAVRAAWTDFSGHSGAGMAVPLTAGTGYFWFFGPANVETVIKVLDGRPVNGHFWVFYGALSDVRYTLTVTDTVTGKVKTYTNPAGQFASVADTLAF